jgi:hypothetical protein
LKFFITDNVVISIILDAIELHASQELILYYTLFISNTTMSTVDTQQAVINRQLTCEQAKHGVIEALRLVPKLGDNMLIGEDYMQFSSEGKVLCSANPHTNSYCLYFDNRGAFQNNLVLVINMLIIHTVSRRMDLRYHRGKSVTILKEEDIRACMDYCEHVTAENGALSLLIRKVSDIGTVEYKGLFYEH